MSIAIIGVTGTSIYLVDSILSDSEFDQLNSVFNQHHAQMVSEQHEKLEEMAEKCRIVAASPRIKAAITRGDHRKLYEHAAAELPRVLFGVGRRPPHHHIKSETPTNWKFAFLDPKGKAIVNPAAPKASNWTRLLNLTEIPEGQKITYIREPKPSPATKHQFYEVTIAPIDSHLGDRSGAIAICVEPGSKNSTTELHTTQTGYFFQNELFIPGFPDEEVDRVGEKIFQQLSSLQPGETIDVEILDNPFLAFARPLTPKSSSMIVKAVSFFPLKESIATRKAQQSKIGLTGLSLLVGGLLISYLISRGLSKPVTMLQEESKENREQRDIAEASQRVTEEKFRSIFENAIEGIFILSGDGVVISANPAFAKICGYQSPQEMMGNGSVAQACQFGSLFADVDKCTALVQQVSQIDSIAGIETELKDSDGNRIWVSLNMSRVADSIDQRGFHYEGTIVDITEKRQAQNELNALNEGLNKALSDLKSTQQQVIQQERLRALGEMASGVAHDFNNALTPILGYSELLLGPADQITPATRQSYLELIKTSAQDAASVVTRLREFYRPSQDEDELTPLNLNKLVEQTINLTQPRWRQQAQSKGITIEVTTDLAADLPQVMGEAPALREMLTNLIFNAVDAMPDGGKIVITSLVHRERILLAVSDNGTGMSEETQRNCLEPFFSTKGDNGTGLGLSMVFGIIKRHDGTINIESELGKGTAFVLSFPPVAKEQSLKLETAKPETKQAHHGPLNILLVDDDNSIRVFLNTVLKREGHKTVAAEDGTQALNLFKANPHFDLVITDKSMPGMNGNQLSKEVKKISQDTPVILLTGFGQFLDPSTMPEIDALTCKPVSINSLKESISSVMSKQPDTEDS